jgi:hypothetical protein
LTVSLTGSTRVIPAITQLPDSGAARRRRQCPQAARIRAGQAKRIDGAEHSGMLKGVMAARYLASRA